MPQFLSSRRRQLYAIWRYQQHRRYIPEDWLFPDFFEHTYLAFVPGWRLVARNPELPLGPENWIWLSRLHVKHRRRLDPLVLSLHAQGHSQRQIAKLLDRSQTSICRILKDARGQENPK